MRFLPQNFNDLLCLCLMTAIISLWILDGLESVAFNLNDEVMGGTVVFFALIGQYYYRKAKTEKET